MGRVKQIDIKNRNYYFYNDMINIKKFDTNLLKIDEKSYKDIDIYNIGYVTIKKIHDYENIYRINSLYLIYLVFDSTDENKELLKKYNDVFNGIRNKIKKNKW